jgi:hypothetical protein
MKEKATPRFKILRRIDVDQQLKTHEITRGMCTGMDSKRVKGILYVCPYFWQGKGTQRQPTQQNFGAPATIRGW